MRYFTMGLRGIMYGCCAAQDELGMSRATFVILEKHALRIPTVSVHVAVHSCDTANTAWT